MRLHLKGLKENTIIYEAMSTLFPCDGGLVEKLCCKVIFAVLVLAIPVVAYADEAAIRADEFYADLLSESELLRWHIAETQSGYIVAGSVYDDSGPRQSAVVIKTDKAGKALWKKIFDEGRSSDFRKAVVVEGGVVLAGSITEMVGGPSEKAFGIVVGLKPGGTIEWDSRIELGRVTRVMDVARTGTGVVAVGRVRRGEYEDSGFIAWIDREGKLLWTKGHVRWVDFVYPLKAGFLAGNSGWLARFDSIGNLLWERSLGEFGYSSVAAVIELEDGGLIISGRTGHHPSIGKLTADGKRVWVKKVEIPGACDALALVQHGKSIGIIGATCKAEPERIWGASITTSGEIKAVRKYLADDGRRGPAEQALINENGVFIAFGQAAGHGGNDASIWLFKSSLWFESPHEK